MDFAIITNNHCSLPFPCSHQYREALAHYLGLQDRADWTACSQSEEAESADAAVFKDAFREYDPALL